MTLPVLNAACSPLVVALYNALMISSFSVVNASSIAVKRFSRFLGCLEVLVLVGLGRRFTHLNRDDVADDTACIERRMQSLGCGAVNALMISWFSVVNASSIAVRRFSRFLGCHWLVISAKDIHWGI